MSRKPPSRPSPPVDPVTVRIARIGSEGDGIARLPAGEPVYVPRTLPGETASALLRRRLAGGWLAEAGDVVAPSAARVEPPCPHFADCGGCALQHWRDDAYRSWKAGLLAHALRAAGFTPPEPLPFHPGAPRERRRIDFAVRRLGGRIVLGLHAARSATVIDLHDCAVLHPKLLALLAPLRTMLGTLRCVRREASAILNLLDAGPDLLLRTDGEADAADRTRLAAFAGRHALCRVSVAVRHAAPETACQHRPPATSLGGIAVTMPPGGFLQATAAGEAAMVAAVRQALPAGLPARTRVAELYAGCGSLTLGLADRFRITAFEGDAAAVDALRQAVNRAGLGGRIAVEPRDLNRQPVPARQLAGFAAILLDPPHAGASAQMDEIAAAAVRTVIYVSCNPSSLSHDAGTLRAAGYRLAAATAIDQFLWSPRLESVSVFRRD